MGETEAEKKLALNDLYFEAGAGLYDSQVLEYNIKYLIYLLDRAGFMDIDAEKAISIIEGKTKHTIGALFKLLREKVILFAADTEDKLNEALKTRNELIHSYLIKDVERIPSIETRQEMVRKIRQFRKRIQEGGNSFGRVVETLTIVATGKSVASIQEDLVKEFERKGWV